MGAHDQPHPFSMRPRGPAMALEEGEEFDLVRRAWIPGEPMRSFVHENIGFELTWVERGSVRFDAGGTALEASAGACVLLPPGIENAATRWRATAHQITLATPLVEEAADALGGAARIPRAGAVLGADQRLATLAQLVVREAQAGTGRDDPGLVSLVHALAVGLVRGAPPSATSRRPDRRIRRSLARIAEDFSVDLDVDTLAREAGLSRFAFLRTFRDQTGETPYQHLLSVRLRHAAALLASSDRSILEVALACGFSDPGRFARMFRARFGCLPRAYRRVAR